MTQCPMTREASEVILDEFRKVVREVFEFQSRGPVTITPNLVSAIADQMGYDPADEAMTSLITVDSDDVECDLMLIGCPSTVKLLSPFEVQDAKDWLGELSNLVAGGLRNNFCDYDVDCQLGLPSSVRYAEWISDDFDWEILCIETQHGTVVAAFRFEVDPEAEWVVNPKNSAEEEGSICLF